jgi:hypothetical protein
MFVARASEANPTKVDYNRDVRPILSNHCYACHGPDDGQRQAGLRLDVAEVATGELESGNRAIVPGNVAGSVLIERVSAKGPGMRMPPPESGEEPLSDEQIDVLRRWIAEGAEYKRHWAFIPPVRPELPQFTPPEGWQDAAPARNPIDAFVRARLLSEDLAPSPEADKVTLVRRVTLDLTGLPPTPAEVDAFLADNSPDAYDKLVDRLLASPRYGEHLARYWLDAVRYGDTHGLHLDNYREIWPYREWVIEAFNRNQPFDEFTIDQLAGDLRENPSNEQLIATGYVRSNVTTSEGGSIEEEVLVRNTVDRVETTATVWLSLTAGCAVCHDHKFDPLTQKEFYQLFAFFNSTADPPLDQNAKLYGPVLRIPSAEQKENLAALAKQIADEKERQGAMLEGLSDDIVAICKKPADKRSEAEKSTLDEKGAGDIADQWHALQESIERLEAEHKKIDEIVPGTLIAREKDTPRPAHILKRGQYDQPQDQVQRGVPTWLHNWPEGAPNDRMGLALWLVTDDNPLTARVFVNRLWQRVFGSGLVETSEDFGIQSQWPSHPELLDWLAVEFRESGWDVKHLMRLLVTSGTYRQSSEFGVRNSELEDRANRLLARGPRFRMDAEMIRDQALYVSGLLVEKIGGPSVKPYQPEGLWEAVGYSTSNTAKFTQDHGEALYRRSLYTFWKRTAPPPTMSIMDAPSREACTVRRPRTNTPLAALALMNDIQFVEAARHLAQRTLTEAGADRDDRLQYMFRLVLSRSPTEREMELLRKQLESHLDRFANDAKAAKALLAVGESPRDEALSPAHQAAWTMVANLVLNLDEALNK